MKSRRSRTSASQITQVYALMIVVITFLMSISTITVVGYRLIDDKRSYGQEVIQSLKNSVSNGTIQWNSWETNYDINTTSTFVSVVEQTDGKTIKQFTTKGTNQLLKKHFRTLTNGKNLEYRKGAGMYYRQQGVQTVTKNGQLVTIQYTVWMSLNRVVRMFVIIIEVIIIILVISLIVGIWLISKLSKRLNKPLVELTKSTHDIFSNSNQSYQETLSVPTNPKEVQELGNEFNNLLGSLNETILKNRQFTSDASHELRTPLAVILGHTELIKKHAADHPEIVPESVEYIDNEAHQMQQLVTSLLELSRSSNVNSNRVSIDVNETVDDIVKMYRNDEDHEIFTNLEPNLMILANHGNLQQILMALIDNARKYSEIGSRIKINAKKVASNVEIRVIDEGIGVNSADKEKIFDRFYRADQSRSKDTSGYGIGLAIVKQLVEVNHGNVSVQDNFPKGSQFILTFDSTEP